MLVPPILREEKTMSQNTSSDLYDPWVKKEEPTSIERHYGEMSRQIE